MKTGSKFQFSAFPQPARVGPGGQIEFMNLEAYVLFSIGEGRHESMLINIAARILAPHMALLQPLLETQSSPDWGVILTYAQMYAAEAEKIGAPDPQYIEIRLTNDTLVITIRPHHPNEPILPEVEEYWYVGVKSTQREGEVVFVMPKSCVDQPYKLADLMVDDEWLNHSFYFGIEPVSSWRRGDYTPVW